MVKWSRAFREGLRARLCDVQCGLWKPEHRGGARSEGLTSHSHRKAGAEWAAPSRYRDRDGASLNGFIHEQGPLEGH